MKENKESYKLKIMKEKDIDIIDIKNTQEEKNYKI